MFDMILLGFEDIETARELDDQLMSMWEELDMLEESGDLDAQDQIFSKYHYNFMALADKSETHIAWAVE